MGQERLRHVVMPALPGPHFVVIHAHLALGFLEGRFDRPSHPANPHQFPLGYPLGRVRQEHLHGPLLETASENRRRLGTGPATLFRTGHAHQRKLGLDRPLRAFLDRVAPPRALGQLRGDIPNPSARGSAGDHPRRLAWPPHRPLARRLDLNPSDPDLRRYGHLHKVPFLQRGYPIEKLRIRTVGLVGKHPAPASAGGTFPRLTSPFTSSSPSVGSVLKVRSSGTP